MAAEVKPDTCQHGETTRNSHDARHGRPAEDFGSPSTNHPEDIMNRTKGFVTGLVIAGLLALGDITTPFTSDGEHPPMVIGLICAVLGVITAAGIVLAWRGSRGAVTAIIVTRLLSAMTALPAFFVDGVPAPAKIAAGAGIAITVLAVALIAPRLRRPAPVAA
jgi:hypothetical protein